MVHLEETEAAPERASEAAGASGDASDAGYAQRIDKEWRDQLASAQEANAGLDENDVDARGSDAFERLAAPFERARRRDASAATTGVGTTSFGCGGTGHPISYTSEANVGVELKGVSKS